MAESLSSMARLTLKQLRRVASEMGVRLYSRKTKCELLKAIGANIATTKEMTDSVESPEAADKSPEVADKSPEAMEMGMAPIATPKAETRVVFLPRDPQWAYVFWEISPESRASAESAGAIRLCLRLNDVTGFHDGGSASHAMQEVPVDANATEWYIPMPLSDRDYRVELGYRLTDGGWLSLACSAPARVPAIQPCDEILDQFVPFSLDVAPTMPLPTPVETSGGDAGLHERLYQTATATTTTTATATVHRRQGGGSERIHEHGGFDRAQPSRHDSGVGMWASGRSESGAGLASRQRAFWLVADAELIVYGATDPSATLSIGGEVVPLSADGTFRIQVPFRDGVQQYDILAVAPDGEQRRDIKLDFRRSTPTDNSNTAAEAAQEWF